MDFIARINGAIAYIEDNLEADIDMKDVARIACMSAFSFQRMFSFVAGIPVSEYIRRRRLSMAALALSRGDMRVTDAALRYGYSSPDAFSRAFRELHGISPSHARTGNAQLKSYARLSFTIQAKGASEMTYRIERKPAFSLIGYRDRFADHDEGAAKIPAVCAGWQREGKLGKLCALPMNPPYGIHGVNNPLKGDAFEYYLAVFSDGQPADGMAKLDVDEYTWAVFALTGPMPDTMTQGFKDIYSEWLPSSGYRHAGGPEIEICADERPVTVADYRSEIWIPVEPV